MAYFRNRPSRSPVSRRSTYGAAGAFLMAAIALAPTGCGQRAPEIKASDEGSARPTTQEIVNGPRTDLSLETIPFRLTVPQSWKLDITGASTVIRGPTPSSSVEITVAFRSVVNPDHKQLLIDAFKAKGATQGYRSVNVRHTDDMDVLNLQQPGPKSNSPLLDDKGNKLRDTSTPLAWNILVFVPDRQLANEFDQYEFSFVGLDDEIYQADKDLLESIMSSLKYDPTVLKAP